MSAPFHCALMKPAEDRLAPELRALPTRDPRIPVVANVDAAPKRDGSAAIEALVRQVSSAVRWEESVRRLASDGVTTYVEVGPGSVLSGLIRKIHRDATVAAFGAPEDLDASAKADRMLNLSGKVALVTGASRGIGAAIARTLAAQGATVVAAARGSNAEATVADIVLKGGKAEAASLDVTDQAAVEAVVSGTIAKHGRIDILVNNAGIARDQLMMRMKRADWDAVIATNLTAALQLHAGGAAADDQAARRAASSPSARSSGRWAMRDR